MQNGVQVSAREGEVLAALGEHLTNAEIGSRLFISVRTVESHVSSLLRKFGAEDRRALATLAGQRSVPDMPPDMPPVHGPGWTTVPAGPGPDRGPARGPAPLPVPLTPFVGRVAERSALAEELGRQRLVTALGPGGIGKTRLALAVAGDVQARFADGAVYVDLVPLSDPGGIATAIATASGLGEQQGRSPLEVVQNWLAPRELLLVLDNCEHLLDGVAGLLERLLAGAPGLRVLTTSRARLLVPFESVFAVPGLSTGGEGDALRLFADRAATAGAPLTEADLDRAAALCDELDGIALAIELAAARLSSLGFAGLEAGLADRLKLLAGGRRADDRHRSLASLLDWSHDLLSIPEQAVLRRVSVFAAPFTAEAAEAVLGDWAPVGPGELPGLLAALADQSLLVARREEEGTRYRALETIRQYGDGLLDRHEEGREAKVRHLHWCIGTAEELCTAQEDSAAWRARHDLVAPELRSGMRWAEQGRHCWEDSYRLARSLGALSFGRGLPGDAQLRYEEAARLAGDDLTRAECLRLAAGAAETRHFGNEALRLHRAAADAAIAGGSRPAAATSLARAAELITRGPGLMASAPAADLGPRLLAEAAELAAGDPGAHAKILVAKAFSGDEWDAEAAAAARAAAELAEQVGDPLTLVSALDCVLAGHLARGEIIEALEVSARRTGILAELPIGAASGLEHFDAYNMAAESAIAAGALDDARAWAQRMHDLPFHREEAHLATSRLLMVTALTGDWGETLELADRFLASWEVAGRPRAGNLSRGAAAAGVAHGMLGNDGARAEWQAIAAGLSSPTAREDHCIEFYDALVLLHRGEVNTAANRLQAEPESFRSWHNGVWRPWYAALWAETAVLAGRPDAAARLARAAPLTAQNPVAAAMVERAAELLSGDDPPGRAVRLRKIAENLAAAGCRYQAARTRVLAGGEDRALGEAEITALGAEPMVTT